MPTNSHGFSPVQMKIMKFFHENPAAIDTPRGISTWTAEDIKSVRTALEGLADHGMLIRHKGSTTIGYSYTQDDKVICKVAQYLKRATKS